MTGGYERLADRQGVLRRASELSAQTIIFDVEPLIAWWDTGQERLDQGIRATLDQVRSMPGVSVVCFATNSARRPSAIPAVPGIRVLYLSSAHKPVRIAAYRDLPRPGVVIGDQAATDGILACRLGYTFLHYTPGLHGAPLGPRLMNHCGRLVLPLLNRGRPDPRLPIHGHRQRRSTACPPAGDAVAQSRALARLLGHADLQGLRGERWERLIGGTVAMMAEKAALGDWSLAFLPVINAAAGPRRRRSYPLPTRRRSGSAACASAAGRLPRRR
jgi:hypothetical protein